MRVLHVLDHSIPSHSGYSFRTLAILREQRKRGWQTFQVTSGKHQPSDADEESIDGWDFFRTRLQKRMSRFAPLRELQLMRALHERLLDVARNVKPDVIHAHSPVVNAWPALQVARRLRLPVVYEVRAFWEDAAVDHGTAAEWGLRYRLTRQLETLALRRVDHVTTICNGLREDMIARGIPAQKITVIPNAVDTEQFMFAGEADAALQHRYGLKDATVLGFIGSFYAYEGLSLLLKALPLLVRQRPAVKVLLVGGGPEEDSLRRQVIEAGLQDHVVFTGRVPNSDVSKFYLLFDLLIYARQPMRLTELVTPLKPLEAMAQGRLFVASDVGGHRELIEHGRTGFLFKAGDAQALGETVDAVLSDPATAESVRTQARRFVEHERTWSKSVARYESVYGSLTGNRVAAYDPMERNWEKTSR